MKFKLGDIAVYKDEFATYKGSVISHRRKTRFPWFWLKEDWYELTGLEINGLAVFGSLSFRGKDLVKVPEKRETNLKPIKGGKDD